MAMGRDAWIVAFVLLCSCLGSYSLTLQVEPKTTECFYEYFEAGQNVSLNYGVTRGGLLDILVQVRPFFPFPPRTSHHITTTLSLPSLEGPQQTRTTHLISSSSFFLLKKKNV